MAVKFSQHHVMHQHALTRSLAYHHAQLEVKRRSSSGAVHTAEEEKERSSSFESRAPTLPSVETESNLSCETKPPDYCPYQLYHNIEDIAPQRDDSCALVTAEVHGNGAKRTPFLVEDVMLKDPEFPNDCAHARSPPNTCGGKEVHSVQAREVENEAAAWKHTQEYCDRARSRVESTNVFLNSDQSQSLGAMREAILAFNHAGTLEFTTETERKHACNCISTNAGAYCISQTCCNSKKTDEPSRTDKYVREIHTPCDSRTCLCLRMQANCGRRGAMRKLVNPIPWPRTSSSFRWGLITSGPGAYLSEAMMDTIISYPALTSLLSPTNAH